MKNKSKKMVMVAMSGVLIALLYHCAAVQQARDAAGMAGEMAQVGGRVVEATTPVVVDKYEPNDDLLHPTMIQMNSTTRATIEPAGDIDVFRVHVASNKREVVQVTFLNSTRNLAPGLYFYNQNREQIGESTGERGAAQVSGQFIAQPNQYYYIAVASGRPDDIDEETSTEFYTLRVEMVE